MEKFELRDENNDDWLQQIASGQTYVNPDFEQDDFGTFLTAHTPIYDSKGRYSGFVGIDFDLQYYLAREARFRTITIASVIAAIFLALIIGYLVALYHATLHRRLEELYEASRHDSLTRMLNRRGAMERIKPRLESHSGPSALLLVDIDNLHIINDVRGLSTGDAVVAQTSEAIRASIDASDECARMGAEFLIFAPGRDAQSACAIARKILSRLSTQGMPLSDVRYSVSIGIGLHEGGGAEFVRMYADADQAMQLAKQAGRNRFEVFDQTTAAELASL
jgi:diguanylate cyclase (GGDEF)-like protein